MTLHDWMRNASTRLAMSGIEASRLEAQLLAAHAQGSNRSAVLAHPGIPVPASADELLQRRLAGEPLAYILGYREFYGRRFTVNRAVLVPRQETEIVIEASLQSAQSGAHVLDVGTGSGCIAITLKLERPDLHVVAVDISDDALKTAKINSRSLGADVTFLRSDLLDSVKTQFDVIVSNPPYVADEAALPREIRDHEPATALFAGPEGTDIYHRLATETAFALLPDGTLVVELGDGMVSRVRALFEASCWKVTAIHPDLGGMPRAMMLVRREE